MKEDRLATRTAPPRKATPNKTDCQIIFMSVHSSNLQAVPSGLSSVGRSLFFWFESQAS